MKDPDKRDQIATVTTVNASRRFLQFLIDWSLIIIVYNILSPFIANDFMVDTYNGPVYDPGKPTLLTIVYLAYFYLFEQFTGTTPGKKWMRHRLINQHIDKPTDGEIFIRTLLRLSPFDAFTAIGNHSFAFHDKLSGTFLVEEEEYRRLKALSLHKKMS